MLHCRVQLSWHGQFHLCWVLLFGANPVRLWENDLQQKALLGFTGLTGLFTALSIKLGPQTD